MATAVITDIINAVEKMVSDFEALIKDAISTIESKGSAIAAEIRTESQQIYTDVRSKISAAIQSFKSRIQARSFSAGTPGTSSATFRSRIDNALRDLVVDLQNIFDRFKNALKVILTDTETAIKDVEGKLTSVVKDVTSVTETTGKDFLRVLRQVATNAETALVHTGSTITHAIEVDASFVVNHGVQIAEAATIAVIQPQTILAFIVGGGFIYAGAVYKA
jgi:ElaB/YqjD/DUF883 family membrane-anchored ribosome-binding protein